MPLSTELAKSVISGGAGHGFAGEEFGQFWVNSRYFTGFPAFITEIAPPDRVFKPSDQDATPCGGGNRPARQFLEAVDEHRSWIGQGRGAALKTSGTSKIRACASVLERTSPLPPFLFAKHLSFRDPELWFLTLTVPAEPTRRLRRMTCCARQGAPNCLFSVEGEGLTSECPSLRP